MAEQVPHQVFSIKDLPTKSVTLYPLRAQIVREIRDIHLEPGLNEVEITGLTPSTDEHSVQIDGKGAATITDLTVELVPNTDDFYDIYSDDDDDVFEDDPSDYEDSDDEVDAVKTVSNEIKELEAAKKEAENREGSAIRQLEALDQYAKSAHAEHTSATDMSRILELYDEKRKEVYKLHAIAKEDVKQLTKQIARKRHEKRIAEKEELIEKRKQKQQKYKVCARNARKRLEKFNEKKRVKDERMKYWPKQVYRVLLRLETASPDTPASSRRNSLDSLTLSGAEHVGKIERIDNEATSSETRSVTLALSYVTSGASWTPRYEINISSVRKTAIIAYRAEFGNWTSETWTDAKLVLSTSQTSYSGLDDKPPTMQPWNVKLGKYSNQDKEGLLSHGELNRSDATQKLKGGKVNRSNLFGYDGPAKPSIFPEAAGYEDVVVRNRIGTVPPPPAASSLFGGMQHLGLPAPERGGLFGSSQPDLAPQPTGFNAFQQQGQQMTQQMQPQHRFDSSNVPQSQIMYSKGFWAPPPDAQGLEDLRNEDDQLDFEESTWEDNGLSATYEVPGTRTIAPASLNRRHKIASLHATNIQLSYIAIPKLRAAAFLRGKIRNPSSSITLLKGMAGVTLDGSFLGNISMPRVSPSQPFTLSLGTDPAIHVSYPKPTVHRSTQGIFNKESAQTFSRSVWLTNTRSTPVELLVLDQIPQSQDERLRIEVLQPKGLHKEGDEVRAGQNAREGGSGFASAGSSSSQKGEGWGKATAGLKKNGEVAWNVNLEKGQACLLRLEYEARLPSQESIVNA